VGRPPERLDRHVDRELRFTWRADVLREIPAAVRFISAEPLLGSLFPAAVAA
jgi:protein gp37